MIEKLENNEATLLMYLANELPPEDRAEVEQMLATDASMRRDLESLRGTLNETTEIFRRLDELQPMPVVPQVAVRQATRVIQQALTDRAVRATADQAEEPRRSAPRWAYVAAAVAALLVGYTAWWGMRPETESNVGPVAMAPDEMSPLLFPYPITPEIEQAVSEFQDAFESVGGLRSDSEPADRLAEAEALLLALRESDEEYWPGLSIQP
jgi:hypothetical protein